MVRQFTASKAASVSEEQGQTLPVAALGRWVTIKKPGVGPSQRGPVTPVRRFRGTFPARAAGPCRAQLRLRGVPVSIKIDGDFMSLEIDGSVVTTARERTDGWWEVSD